MVGKSHTVFLADTTVNERPNAHYVKPDVEETPNVIKCLAALKLKQGMPDGVSPDVWEVQRHHWEAANAKVEGQHYRIITDSEGKQKVIQLDAEGRVPKVPLTSKWLISLNYMLCGVEPVSNSHFAVVCTPYVFNKYAGIFGLTGSVGGKAELKYLTETYHAVKFDAPRFLDTCKGNARKVVRNHGVELVDGPKALISRVVALCHEYFRQVPVLVIASSSEELSKIHGAVRDGGVVPADEVQRFSEFDANGVSLKAQWQTIIDDATKRLGSVEENRCRVTVTDRFGGRGHDFQVVDKEANANGGMLVIATSIPDEREWIQWKGRTARQDRPGQFYVILDKKAPPFSEKKDLLKKVEACKKNGEVDHDARIELMLDSADDGIGDKLKAFKEEQERGEKLNELAEKYYQANPRSFDGPWPTERESDLKMRYLMATCSKDKPSDVKKKAKEVLGIDLD